MKTDKRSKPERSRDSELAREIAEFIAARGFRFDGYEYRAWVLTSFATWAALADLEPEFGLVPKDPDSPSGGSAE